MRKLLFFLGLVYFGNITAQSTRTCLYEYFCGENCPPCATTAPPLYALLSSPTNTPKIISIEWETPIPSAPSNTWSLYRTNNSECDWRYRSISGGGYGYNPPITYVPFGKIDGQAQTLFGASNDQAVNLNSQVIATAQSFTTPFSIGMTREWNSSQGAVNLTVSINASANFTTSGPLRFRLVMVEREIHFTTPPGTNGQKDFENVAVKSFPTLQQGTLLSSTWAPGQSQTFTINCPIPAYVRSKSEVAFVGFIQDDGTQKVWQTALCDKAKIIDDAKIVSVLIPETACGSLITRFGVKNTGSNLINSINITPYIDGIAQAQQFYATNLSPDSVAFFTYPIPALNAGKHSFSVSLTKVNGFNQFQQNVVNNSFTFMNILQYQNKVIMEGFEGNFPPNMWTILNIEKKQITWSKNASCGGFMYSHSCAELNLSNIQGQVDELLLPPLDLSGASNNISFSFDYAYAKVNINPQNYQDTLRVLFSQDCGQTWNLLYENSGDDLITYELSNASTHPVNGSEWKQVMFYLNANLSPKVLIKFVTVSAANGLLHIDNVNLTQSNQVGLTNRESTANNIQLFPNPGSNYIEVLMESKKQATVHLRLLNALNQTMFDESKVLDSGNNKMGVDVSTFPAGMYQVVIETEDKLVCKKLNIIK